MNTQHTPGPWHVGTRTGQRYVYGPLGEEVAGPSVFTSGHEETRANARLIASAPDLLAFAERVAALGRLSHANMKPEDYAEMIDHARAAIARATGSTAEWTGADAKGCGDYRSNEELAAHYPVKTMWTEGEGVK
jgi:hypothetical protein